MNPVIDEYSVLSELQETKKPERKPVKSKGMSRAALKRGGKIRSRDICLLATSLARLLEGGIPLLRALQILENETENNKFGHLLSEIQKNIREGSSLSQSLSKQCNTFPEYFIQIIWVGEVAGRLPELLKVLGRDMQNRERIKRRIIEAVSYPCFIIVMAVLALGFLFQWVLPKLVVLYQDFDTELPTVTRVVLWIGHHYVPFFILLMVAGSFIGLFCKTKKINLIDSMRKWGLFKATYDSVFRLKFSSLLALQLEAGVPILTAIETLETSASSSLFKSDLGEMRQKLSQGGGVAESLKTASWMKGTAVALIASGEESGRIPETLNHIACDVQAELESRLTLFMKLLEPAMILIVGGAVSLVVLSILLPVMQMNTLVR